MTLKKPKTHRVMGFLKFFFIEDLVCVMIFMRVDPLIPKSVVATGPH